MNRTLEITPRVHLSHVSRTFSSASRGQPPFQALGDVSLELWPGEFVCLLGPSGCGKSTILNLIAGFDRPDAGVVSIDAKPVKHPGPDRGFVFQQPTLFPWLNVLDNVTFGPRMAGVSKAQYLDDAYRYLALVGLKGFEHHATWQLSGGMRQRAALARAWLPNPGILLMDEPFGALDSQTRLTMQELLTSVWAATGTTILFVTHDVDEALLLADRVLIMSARPGRIREHLHVPFERPRDIEDLADDPEFGRLRRHVLHIIRDEAHRHAGQELS
ncbi:ABC transporter ATP-binding protein [Pandoraea sputorum]|uniref:ABC transporter ATP-binding protein n=1 Tax=Pandoraea sputorum TaxID=93222 RepID=UPI0012410200|nr:ABC transporter ATP-binding protein [Pandoraea sputorum]VVE78552.1 ABC transporter ATP-binding protein [Pandoraea sputorum]